jgi:hypothetical protein
MAEIEKIKGEYKDGEIEVWGNRAEHMNNAESGSVPLLITLKVDL